MKFHGQLLAWYGRKLLPPILILLPGAVLALLLYPEVLRGFSHRISLPLLVIALHSLLISTAIGRVRAEDFGFLYTRGYTKDALWGHAILASFLAVLVVWLPASLTIWLGIRSWFQEELLGNPEFPLMAPVEYPEPVLWGVTYVLFVGVFHYAWVRLSHPTSERLMGYLLAVAVPVGFFIAVTSRYVMSFPIFLCGVLVVSGAVALVGAWKCHQRVEVEA